MCVRGVARGCVLLRVAVCGRALRVSCCVMLCAVVCCCVLLCGIVRALWCGVVLCAVACCCVLLREVVRCWVMLHEVVDAV